MIEYCDENHLLPDRTFAYRKHKSASICLNEILLCIATLKKNGFKVILLALDINNAYNCVDNNLLNRMLLDGGFPAVYVKWIYNFLSERVLKLGDDQVVVSDGLPQGSCLSPFLFNLSLHNAEDESTKIFEFVDDFLILTFDKDFDVATIYIAKGSRKEVVISLNNTHIEQVKKLKFLGRTINMSSTGGDHYERVFIKSLSTVKESDASLTENAAGCAIIDVSNDAEYLFRIAHRTSSMFAELCAISRAIDSAISAGVEKLVIFTDSLLSCQVLNVSTTKNYCVASIHNKIRNSQIRECHLLWTPSHVGIDINERTDDAAKNATSIGA
ncbi:hypothetical protein CVS40_4247 [Lucilia cuprina]|nr:hypothetical protein CVS40_4247 [Lucilia cuprina]